MSEPSEPTIPPRQPVPRHTTPTWEMELLISGATVFALLQLPALIDDGVNHLMPRFERDAAMLVLLPSIYLKSAVHALIVTFILHLATRGYWVGLVGLASVHPDGVRWDRLQWGPHYLATIRERLASLPELIERADNRASQVFGFGIGLALVLLAPLLFVTITAALAYGLYELVDRRWTWNLIWNGFLAALFLPYLFLVLVDRSIGRRLAPGSRAARLVGGGFRLYLRLGFISFVNYPVTMFVSRAGRRRGGLFVGSLILVLVSFSMFQHFWSAVGPRIGQYGRLTHAAPGEARAILAQHYENRRDPDAYRAALPYIPSEIAQGDWLRLFIPYRPTRDNAAVDRECPAAPETAADRVADEFMACLARLFPIELDGEAIADPAFDRAEDPVTGARGVIAMIRIADLTPGRHELRVARPSRPDPRPDDPVELPYRIPFWR